MGFGEVGSGLCLGRGVSSRLRLAVLDRLRCGFMCLWSRRLAKPFHVAA